MVGHGVIPLPDLETRRSSSSHITGNVAHAIIPDLCVADVRSSMQNARRIVESPQRERSPMRRQRRCDHLADISGDHSAMSGGAPACRLTRIQPPLGDIHRAGRARVSSPRVVEAASVSQRTGDWRVPDFGPDLRVARRSLWRRHGRHRATHRAPSEGQTHSIGTIGMHM